jgi:hypothetical protein
MSNVILGRTPEQSEIVQAYGTLGPSRSRNRALRVRRAGARA